MNKKLVHKLIPVLISALAIIIFWLSSRTMPVVIIFIPGVILSFLLSRIIPRKSEYLPSFLNIYLIALAVQMLHFAEEYTMGFVKELPSLLGADPYPLEYWVNFNMIAYAIFILGAIVLYKNLKALVIVPVFFVVVGAIINAFGHLALSIYAGGYFPGLYTSLLYWVIALRLGNDIVKLLHKTRLER